MRGKPFGLRLIVGARTAMHSAQNFHITANTGKADRLIQSNLESAVLNSLRTARCCSKLSTRLHNSPLLNCTTT